MHAGNELIAISCATLEKINSSTAAVSTVMWKTPAFKVAEHSFDSFYVAVIHITTPCQKGNSYKTQTRQEKKETIVSKATLKF